MQTGDAVKLGIACVCLGGATAWWLVNREVEDDYTVPAAAVQQAPTQNVDQVDQGSNKGKKKKTKPPSARINEDIG